MRKVISNHKSLIRKSLILILSLLLVSVYWLLFTSPINAQSESTIAGEKTESTQGSSVRDKVREAIENLVHKPKAVVGVLEQITDSTLQIKDRDGVLKQVATTPETVYNRVTKGKREEIKFNDLALGDYTLAMGFRNGNEILEAKRVIVYDVEPKNNRHAVFGIVTENVKGIIKIKHQKQDKTWTIETSSSTEVWAILDGKKIGLKVSDIKPQDRIAAAGIPDAKKPDTLDAEKIFLIPSDPTSLKKAATPTPKATPKP